MLFSFLHSVLALSNRKDLGYIEVGLQCLRFMQYVYFTASKLNEYCTLYACTVHFLARSIFKRRLINTYVPSCFFLRWRLHFCNSHAILTLAVNKLWEKIYFTLVLMQKFHADHLSHVQKCTPDFCCIVPLGHTTPRLCTVVCTQYVYMLDPFCLIRP